MDQQAANAEAKRRAKRAQESIYVAWQELDQLAYRKLGVELPPNVTSVLGDVSSQLLKLRSQLQKIV